MVDKVSKGKKPVSINSYLSLDDKVHGLGDWSGLFDSVFIPHYTKSYWRRDKMVETFKNWAVEAKFITDFDREDLQSSNSSFMRCLIPNDVIVNDKDNHLYLPLLVEISLLVKSFHIYFSMLKSNSNSSLIIEDDIEFKYGSDSKLLMEVIRLIPSNFAFIQLGNSLEFQTHGVGFKEQKIMFSQQFIRNCTNL
jgi:hypothetical protein